MYEEGDKDEKTTIKMLKIIWHLRNHTNLVPSMMKLKSLGQNNNNNNPCNRKIPTQPAMKTGTTMQMKQKDLKTNKERFLKKRNKKLFRKRKNKMKNKQMFQATELH